MSTSKRNRLLMGILSGFFLSTIFPDEPIALAIMEALPTPEMLGRGWARDITILFDPLSRPSEIFPPGIAESFKADRRKAVENPKSRLSGSAYVHFDFASTNRAARFIVQVERYRSRERLIKDFEPLLTLNNEQYRTTRVDGVGEAAVVCRAASGHGETLWFRRDNFRVSISPLGSGRSWEKDPALQDLAKAMDERLTVRSPNNL